MGENMQTILRAPPGSIWAQTRANSGGHSNAPAPALPRPPPFFFLVWRKCQWEMVKATSALRYWNKHAKPKKKRKEKYKEKLDAGQTKYKGNMDGRTTPSWWVGGWRAHPWKLKQSPRDDGWWGGLVLPTSYPGSLLSCNRCCRWRKLINAQGGNVVAHGERNQKSGLDATNIYVCMYVQDGSPPLR